MKKFKVFIYALLVFIFVSCSSKEIKPLENKQFTSQTGGYVIIEKEKFKSPKLIFKGPSMINKNSSLKDREGKEEKFKKGEKREYSNVKIVKKDNKKYIKAEGFKYKLVLIDENTIKDEEDNEVYRFINLHKK